MYKILYIEDDEKELEDFEKLVNEQKLDYNYTVTHSILEAKKILTDSTFDVILADYVVSDGTAFEILEMKRKEPLIIITAWGNEEVAVTALKSGAYDYLVKDNKNSFFRVLSIRIENALKQKKIEEELKLLSMAIEQGPALVVITDLEGKIKYVNKRFIDFTGFTYDEVIGENPGFLKTGDIPKEEYKKLWDTIKTGGEWKGEFYNTKKNGEKFWEYAAITPIRDKDGEITNFIKVAKDITARKMHEETLKKSKDKYKTLADSLPQTVFEIDKRGYIKFMNQTGLDVLGYTEEDLEKGLNIFQIVLKEEREKIKKNFSEISNSEDFVFTEYNIIKKDGTSFPILHYSNPILENNEIIGFRGIAVDITKMKESEKALKESEERFRTIVQNINEYIYSVTYKNGKVDTTYHSPKCLNVTGYHQKEYESNPDLWFSMIYEEDQEKVNKFLEDVERKFLPSTIEHRIITKTEEIKWVSNTVTATIDEKNNLQRLDGFILDITEHKRLLEELHALSLVDELTGLYNRRGFTTLAKQQLKFSSRSKRKIILLFIDMDNMKQINDVLGHLEGDKAIIDLSNILKKTFRDSDIIARIGGDEFIVLTTSNISANGNVFISRIQENIALLNQSEKNVFKLAVSIGRSFYDPDNPCSIEELIDKADSSMYIDKRNKKK
ncbi:MAG: hypothetical protein A2086_09405 [Spirochaetes bacterium GWD1_27_9]|nr:MAG: hypothetical protein A2Y34_03035 [Spirochaetes bacterium GWC1_27_15]OHD29797.1 MAG: hypothetical protein A2086_09405 [Spirochaetes bacterium GWD1_27_9]